MLLFNGSEARVAVTPDKTVYDTIIHNGAEVSNVVTLDCYNYGGNNYRWLFNGVNNVYFMGDSWTGDNYADVNVGTEYNSKLNKGLSYTKTGSNVYIGVSIERFFVMNVVSAFNGCTKLKEFFNGSVLYSMHTNDALNYITFGKMNCAKLCSDCCNLEGSPSCSDNVVNASYMYFNCSNLIRSPLCGANVVDASHMYAYCSNLNKSPVCGDNVVNASYMYCNCTNLRYDVICGANVVNASYMYCNCINLLNGATVGDNVEDASGMFYGCTNLLAGAMCGVNVTNTYRMYFNCANLRYNAICCGDNVINACQMYMNCYNLTGSPVCGDNVVNAMHMYYHCNNLTGSPVCGNNVVDASHMYYNCWNLTGSPVCGVNVVNASGMYIGCSNLTGDAYIYSPVLRLMLSMFNGCVNLSNKVHINHLIPMEPSNYIYNCLINNYTNIRFAPENIYNDL